MSRSFKHPLYSSNGSGYYEDGLDVAAITYRVTYNGANGEHFKKMALGMLNRDYLGSMGDTVALGVSPN